MSWTELCPSGAWGCWNQWLLWLHRLLIEWHKLNLNKAGTFGTGRNLKQMRNIFGSCLFYPVLHLWWNRIQSFMLRGCTAMEGSRNKKCLTVLGSNLTKQCIVEILRDIQSQMVQINIFGQRAPNKPAWCCLLSGREANTFIIPNNNMLSYFFRRSNTTGV